MINYAAPSINHKTITGLSVQEVLESRQKNGENRLPSEKGLSAWSILVSQLKSPLVYIILVAAGVSLAVRQLEDFAIIMVVVVVDVVLGFIQEYRAQQTYVALKGLLKPMTTVIRDGQRKEIELWELVPGDIAVLTSGERIPGDGKLVESSRLSIDEAILTGESEAVSKSTADGSSTVFMGTTVITGHALMEVTSTGPRTELGQIATSLSEHVEEETPLQVRLKSFSKTLTYIVVAFTVCILVVGMIMGRGFLDMLRTSIILAIAAVPEGLLIAVTVILVLGMRKILKRNGLVKKMLAVETLGSVTVICTDKTGTLTEGRMRVNRADLRDRKHAMEAMVLCSNLEGPVEVALWEYAQGQMNADPLLIVESSNRVGEELFSSETKFMITTAEYAGECHNYLKGAPEIILGMCSISEPERRAIMQQVEEWAGSGLRLLGLAYRETGDLEDRSGYSWTGLLGMEDPIREGVHESIEVAHKAGIQVKMITGDYRLTAERIGRNIGLFRDGDEILEGSQMAELSDEQLQERVRRVSIFARIRPNDKLRIIKALQANKEVTAMIGDGINDAPALKRANIGVVVGSATDVAKEIADLILLDNNFKTVVSAVEEGRIIFENIRKVVGYTLSNSFAEVLTIFTAMVLQWPTPLLVAQILWIHLICDGPSDIVLGFEPKEEGIMEEKPKSVNEPVLPPLGLSLIATISIASSIAALLIFGYYFRIHGDAAEGRSLVFASFAINSMIYIFAYRSLRRPITRMSGLTQNKPLIYAVVAGLLTAFVAFLIPGIRSMLDIVPLTLIQWVLIVGWAFVLLLLVEIGKYLTNRGYRHLKKPASR